MNFLRAGIRHWRGEHSTNGHLSSLQRAEYGKLFSTSEKLPKNDCNKYVAANTLKTEKLDKTAIKH